MAILDHLYLLKQDISEWNVWRALQRFFEARVGESENQIYQRFKPAFESLKKVTELPALEDESPKGIQAVPEGDI